jgi:hypothetical protein
MHVAARTAVALPLALLQFALPALAQTDSAPIVVPAQKLSPAQEALPLPPDTLDPEPEAPHPAAAPAPTPRAVAPAPPEAPPPAEDYPLSMQILQPHLASGWNPLTISRGGIETPNILEAVSGSPRAESLVRAGESQAATGAILVISGLVVSLTTLLIGIPVISANQSPYNDQSGAWAGVLVGALVGGILTGVGSAIQSGGQHAVLEGVNAYNADLLDGRLVAPAALAVPAR